MLEALLVILLVLAVAALVTSPFRASHSAPAADADLDRDALEAAKEAKYREIREAELDHRTGKLSDEDYAAVDARLRAEAMEILRDLDEVG